MAYAEWPLPAIGPNFFRFGPLDQRARGANDGPKALRYRTAEKIRTVNLGWQLQPDELATYNTFFRTTLKRGVKWFTIQLPVVENPDYNNEAGEPSLIRFTKPPVLKKGKGTSWMVEAEADWDTRYPYGPEEEPPPVDEVMIGWTAPIDDEDGEVVESNSGTRNDYYDPNFHELYAGVVDYDGQTVVWSVDWEPLYGQAAPTLTPLSGGRVKVTFYRNAFGGSSDEFGAGLATLSATIDGEPAGNEITAAIDSDLYSVLTWEGPPEPPPDVDGFLDTFVGSGSIYAHTPDASPGGEYISDDLNTTDPNVGSGVMILRNGEEADYVSATYEFNDPFTFASGINLEVKFTPRENSQNGIRLTIGWSYGEGETIFVLYASYGDIGFYSTTEEVDVEDEATLDVDVEYTLRLEIEEEQQRLYLDGDLIGTSDVSIDLSDAFATRLWLWAQGPTQYVEVNEYSAIRPI